MGDSNVFDMAIVGGGLAGLTAGLRAAELGLRTVLLEQGDGADYPCNSRHSGGIVHIGFFDPFRPAEELAGIVRQLTDNEARPELVGTLTRNGARMITWLGEKGARFMRFNQQEGYRWCMAPPRALRAGIDWKDRGPDQLLRSLATQFVGLGGTMRLRTRATGLVMQDGACIGIKGESDGREEVWSARHCLLADGGFQSDRDLFEQHIGRDFTAVFQRGARTGLGAGLRMATSAGAALTETNRFYGHVLCRDARHNDQVWPYPEVDAIATAGLVVDGTGRRVVDEGRTGVFLANALASFPAETVFHAIFDQAIWDGPGTSARIPANPLLERAGGTVLRADTLVELAAKIGVPAAALTETLDGYNGALADGTLDQLGVPRSGRIQPHPIGQPPFMAIPICPGITYTMGGLAIDEHAQVLNKAGQPIKGLLAAGATTGGLEGGRNAVYIGGLIKAGVFGLVAAERAAALRDGGATPAAAAPMPTAAPAKHGLARFPILRATLRYGTPAAAALGLLVALCVSFAAWPSLGLVSMIPAVVLGAVAAVAILAFAELVRLITELLIPD